MSSRIFAVSLLLGAGCSHVKAVESPASGADAGSAEPAASSPNAETAQPAAHPQAARAAAAPGRPPLATSPAGLMLPDGPRLLQEALAKKGYLKEAPSGAFDGRTREAVKRFQAENALPSTGAPDEETLRKLDLDPKKVFRSPRQATSD